MYLYFIFCLLQQSLQDLNVSINSDSPLPNDDGVSSDSDDELATAPQLHLTSQEKSNFCFCLQQKGDTT